MRDSTIKEGFNIDHYLCGEDIRYPTLILEGEFGTIGYALDRETGVLRRICICAAHCSDECHCGAWDLTDLKT
jgi:hypothetical protein